MQNFRKQQKHCKTGMHNEFMRSTILAGWLLHVEGNANLYAIGYPFMHTESRPNPLPRFL